MWNDEGGANEEKPFDELTESEKRNARERYEDEVDDYSDNTTKFSDYQLEGEKENYKEVLVTMPTRNDNLSEKEYEEFRRIDDKVYYRDWETDRKSTRLNYSHSGESRMPSSA